MFYDCRGWWSEPQKAAGFRPPPGIGRRFVLSTRSPPRAVSGLLPLPQGDVVFPYFKESLILCISLDCSIYSIIRKDGWHMQPLIIFPSFTSN